MKTIFQSISVCFTLVLFAYSCKRDTGPIEPALEVAQSVSVAQDSIHHKVLSPYVILNPITNLVMHPSGCGYVFNPHDTITTYDLDLDSNGVADLQFLSKAYYEFHSASSPCVNYLRSTNISALNSSDSLGFIPYTPINMYIFKTLFHSLGDTIDGTNRFQSQSGFSFYVYMGMSSPEAIHGGDFYLPLKRTLNNKTMYGWMKIDTIGYGGIIIKEYAINNTNGNKIICGQTH